MTSTGNADRLILVSGATGNQGGAVARALLARGFRVRALTRRPHGQAATALLAAGAEIHAGDLDDHSTLERAVEGVHGVYSVQNFEFDGTVAEVRRGCALAAAAAGVSHFVYSSVGGADRDTGISFHDSKLSVERHIAALGLPATIFRPVFFMRNWYPLRDHIRAGVLPWPLRPDKTHQQLAPADLGAFVARAFEEPGRWIGRTVELAGDELTMTETAATFGRVIGRPVRYEHVPWSRFAEIMRAATGFTPGADLARMFQWFNESGFAADISTLRHEYPELATLDGYLSSTRWGETADTR